VHWLNAPARWSEEAGLLTVTADPGTDFWRTTSYGYIRDSGDGGVATPGSSGIKEPGPGTRSAHPSWPGRGAEAKMMIT
jgi:hypothetical protein